MNRIIKFRSYDKEENKMFKPIYEAYKGNLLDLSITFSGELLRRTLLEPSEHESRFKNRYVLMQFTGFMDSDGNEIYEGDILQDIIIDEDTGQKIESKETVYFDEAIGSWMLDQIFKQDQTYGTSLFQNLIDFEYRIIGNVFENPELLK